MPFGNAQTPGTPGLIVDEAVPPVANAASQYLKSAATAIYIGADDVASPVAMFARDTTNSIICQSDNDGTSWSSSRTLPTNVTFGNFNAILRFGAKVYAHAFDSVAAKWGVYSATPVAQAGNWTDWSAALVQTAATSAQPTVFSASNWTANNYLYLGEYGDPVGGPSLYRSADGITWETIFGPDATIRHCHAIWPDPYKPGHVYVTFGDGTAKTIMRSTNYGAAGSWTVLVASSAWQAVQVSADANYIYFAGDSMRGTFYVIRRRDDTIARGTINYHAFLAPLFTKTAPRTITDGSLTSSSKTITSATAAFTAADVGRLVFFSGTQLPHITYLTAVSNATTATLADASNATIASRTVTLAGDTYLANAYFGAVDPATGAYYCVANDASNAGILQGLFVASSVGGSMIVLDPGGAGINMNSVVAIRNGNVYAGQFKRPLLTAVQLANL